MLCAIATELGTSGGFGRNFELALGSARRFDQATAQTTVRIGRIAHVEHSRSLLVLGQFAAAIFDFEHVVVTGFVLGDDICLMR